MTTDSHRIEGMDPKDKRALLTRLLQERAAGVGETFPLSSGQEALWFLYELDPGNVAYNVAFCGRVRSIVEPERLDYAIRRVVERHPMLRCTFALTEQGHRQRVGRIPEACLEVVDASGWDEEGLRARVREAYRQPFDLRTGPVFRAVLFRRQDTDHVLLFVVHHIVFDARSLGVVLGDLSVFYEQGPSANPSGPRGSYEGFVRWQQEMLQSGSGEEMWEYWRARLGGSLPVTDIPGDHTRPVVRNFRGATCHFEIPEPLCAGIRELARSENATPFMVLAAAFHALLHRYTGQQEVLIGTPLAGRPLTEFEDVVGYFVNLVVLRAPIEPGTSFRRYVAEMRKAVLGGLKHGDFPFLEIVKRLNPVRDDSRTPLFQVVFNLVKADQIRASRDIADRDTSDSMRLGSLEIEPFPLEQQEGQIDLDLNVLDTGGSMPAILKYSTDLFDAGTIERMAGHFRTLLEAAVSDPDRRVSDLPLLSPDEERKILVEWNRTDGDYSTDITLQELVEAQVERTPEAVAVVSEAGAITYRELDACANRIAHRLRKLGAGPDALVGVCIDRSIDLVAAMLGTLKAGAAYLPIDGSYPHDRIVYMCTDSRVAVILTERRFEPDLPDLGVPVVVLDADPLLDGESPSRPERVATPESLAYVIYTSGSTGKPKGAMIHHRAIVNHMLWMQSQWPIGADDVVLQKTSTSFDPSVWEIWAPLLCGARLVMARPGTQGDPRYLVGAVINHEVTVLRLVPSVLELVVREPGFERCTSLRRLFVGGEVLSRALVEQVWNRLDVEVANLYGPTEVTIVSTSWVAQRGQGPFPPKVPIGRPITNARAYVLDAELRPVPNGVPGELHMGGVGVGRGYLRRPELTSERFIPDPFVPGGRLYKTGDVCRYRADGVIEYLGRNDFQVKVRGLRIELGEIEAALSEHPTVGQVVVVSREETPGDVRLLAYLVPHADVSPSVADLRVFLKDRLPEYMVPSAFVILPSLPLNPSGKVDRKALPAPERDGGEAAAYEAPRTHTEETLAGIFAEVLKVERAGIRDDFFELGGHSLLAIQLLSRVRAALGVELPVRALFENRTVAALAERVEKELARSPGGMEEIGVAIPLVSRENRSSFLLSFAQQRLWFLEQLAPGLVAYNLGGALRLQGPLDIACLEKALWTIVGRHESLRTTFRTEGDHPLQIVSEANTSHLPMIDLSGLPPEQREEEVLRLASIEGQRPFDLARGPLFRNALYRLGPEHHILTGFVHHIVYDGWSSGVFTRELGPVYDDIREGRELSLPELPIQYPDYTEWQRGWLQGETLERMLSYWRGRLKGASGVLDLPADHLRPLVTRHRGAQVRFVIPLPVAQALSALAQREGATLFMALLAAYKLLLSRYSGQEDIVVGSPIAGRDRSELEGLIGLFVNTLVLRTDLSGAPGFLELLRRVRETCLGAYAHQLFPFEKLVEELKPERDLSRNPLFQMMFVLQNYPMQPYSLRELTVTPLELERKATQVDVALYMQESADGLLGVFEYSTDLFDAGRIERMAGHFRTLLEAVVSEPDRRVSDLPLLTEAERRQVLMEWNATSKAYPETTIHRLIEDQVRRTPEAVALAFEGRTMGYGELNSRANRLARHLRGLGVGPNTLVGLCIERSFEMVVGLLGILKSGGAYVPVDPGYPSDRQSYMIEDSRAPVLLTQESLAGGLASSGARVVVLDTGWEEIGRHSDGNLEDGSGPGDLAYVIYTSGSTGKPKGAMNEHRAVCNRLLWMQDTYGLTASDRVLQKTPFSFDVSVWEFFWPLMTGARLVIARPEGHKDPSYLVQRIREEGITTLHFVPSMLRVFLEAEGVEECSSVKRVICSGEALPYELQERFFGRLGVAELHNLYGPTEAAVDVTWWPCERGSARKIVPIGRPVANTQMYVLDSSLNPVPVGVPGELYIGGVQVGRGYWGRPELTAEKFIPDPFVPGGRLYKTGDLSRWLPDGAIEYLGRNDFQVKVRGLRIELGEIEAALSEHPTVGQAVVVSREETPGDVRLVAYLVPRADASPSVADLRVFLKDRLPEYMVPSAFVILPSLPLNPSGKVDRKALPVPDGMRSSLATRYEAPRTEMEAMIAGLWKDVLRLEKVGVHDNFFDLGGHSLLLVQVQARLERHLKRKLAVVDLFQYPSIETLSRHLTSDEDVAPAHERIDSRADQQRHAMSRHRDRKRQEGGTLEQ